MPEKSKTYEKSAPRVYIRTFGCQMNKLDSELCSGMLIAHGFSLAEDINDADIILYNTCSVRRHAEERVYSHISALKARKVKEPELIIGVLGCMAQNHGKEIINRMPYVDLVLGTGMVHKLPDLIEMIASNQRRIIVTEKGQYVEIPRVVNYGQKRSQAYVSVMRGCDNYCSYCIVPYVRGREVSRDIEDIVKEVMLLVENGCREITLLGQNINSYGKGLNKDINLATLLWTLDKIDGLDRIRFITSHPKDMSRDMLEAMQWLPKVCKYLHLPAQSGSDRILSKMNRRYTNHYYRGLISLSRELIPDISISSDFIVGFPGESNDDFQDTVKLIEEVRFFNSFVFKYSPRPGTKAANMADDVPEDVKRARNHVLLELQREISSEENRKLVGKTLEILVEGENKKYLSTNQLVPNKKPYTGNLIGRTEYNHIVVFNGGLDLIGGLVKVKILDSTDLTLFGSQLNYTVNQEPVTV